MSEMRPSPEFEEQVRTTVAVPGADPEFVNQLRNKLVRSPVRMKSRFVIRPAWALAFVLALAVIIVSVPHVAAAIGKLIGYVPNVGLVENTGDLRILDHSYAATRDGVTLTINYVLVDKDHVEVIYDVHGVAPENDNNYAADAATNPKAFCGGVEVGDAYNKEGDPILKLPDGTLLERDLTGRYPQNVFVMKPVYDAHVPVDVLEMTFMLKCIPNARLGAVPENWEIPFKLKFVPADQVFGDPVIDVNITSEPAVTEVVPFDSTVRPPQVTFALERVVQTDTESVFYIRLNVANPDPAMVTVFPRNVYVIDSLGQKIQLTNNTPYSEDPNTVWEYVSTAKPTAGVLTLVVDDAVIKYSLSDEMMFNFNAGTNPQHEQIWELNKMFDIAGYTVKVESVRAVTFADVEDNPEISDPNGAPDHPEGSQGFDNGYQFKIGIEQPNELSGVQLNVQSDLCGMGDVRPLLSSPMIYYTDLCRDGYPKGKVNVTLRSVSILVKNVGQVIWSPGNAIAPVTGVPVSTKPIVKMKLEKVASLDTGYVFYISFDMENKDPSLISIMPVQAYLVDSQGEKITLIGNYVLQPFEHRLGSLFQFTSQFKPADGPLTIVVENATAFYAPLHSDPPQATPEEMNFTFNVGENPKQGQTWELNKEFTIAGYPIRITSAKAVTWDEVKLPEWGDADSQGFEYGYQFAVESGPSVKMIADMDIMSEASICGNSVGTTFFPQSSALLYTLLCRDSYPKGDVTVQIWQLSVLVENTWQVTWNP